MITSEYPKMSFTERKEKENLIERVLLKYKDKLSILEKERFRDYMNQTTKSFSEIEQLLRNLFILEENQFMNTLVEYGVIMSNDPSDKEEKHFNEIEEVVEVEEEIPKNISPIDIPLDSENFIVDTSYGDTTYNNDFNAIINKEKDVPPLMVDQSQSYEMEFPNTDRIDPNDTITEEEKVLITQDIIQKNQQSILPNTIGGYINITLLVIVLNIVGGLILWLMLNVFYSAMI